jgi:hypothetical protein
VSKRSREEKRTRELTDHVSPVLLLLYKIVVILPLIETGRLIWQQRQTRVFA